ncbi:MAG: hypothetical protein ACXWC0_30365 [Burkholderiales bacterium]
MATSPASPEKWIAAGSRPVHFPIVTIGEEALEVPGVEPAVLL